MDAMRFDRWSQAGWMSVLPGGMLATAYAQHVGFTGWLWVVLWASHAACIFFPYASLLRLQQDYTDLARSKREAGQRWEEERQRLTRKD